jgi:hypothetical protein
MVYVIAHVALMVSIDGCLSGDHGRTFCMFFCIFSSHDHGLFSPVTLNISATTTTIIITAMR